MRSDRNRNRNQSTDGFVADENLNQYGEDTPEQEEVQRGSNISGE